ncbi:MAG: hypothetical protein ACOYO1_02470 [Bacteroidales bacterium]
MEEIKSDEIRSMNLSELANKYNVHPRTMRKWLNMIKKTKPEIELDGYIYTPKQLRVIFEHLG